VYLLAESSALMVTCPQQLYRLFTYHTKTQIVQQVDGLLFSVPLIAIGNQDKMGI